MVMPCSRSAFRPSVKSEKSIGPALRFFEAFSTELHLVFVHRLRVVQQPADQRALPVVHAAGGADAEQPLSIWLAMHAIRSIPRASSAPSSRPDRGR